jgi:hypothetical protein
VSSERSHCRCGRPPFGGFAAHAAFLAVLAAAAPARAQEAVALDRATIRRNDFSPQHAAFELRVGPYRPRIDDNLPTDAYEDFFGDSARYMFGFELDWQALRIPYLGTLGPGIGWGYTQMSARNQVPPDSAEPDAVVSQESTLNIMPIYGVGVLRVDALARRYGVPLVPYAKLGLSYAFWWINDGVGTATNDAGVKGRDISIGTQAALGGMFLLDILEPSAALGADNESGVNNSYLFFEWSMSNYGGDQMNVGSSSWVTGLAFEM